MIQFHWMLLSLLRLDYIARTCYWTARSPMLSVETRNLLITLFVERVSELLKRTCFKVPKQVCLKMGNTQNGKFTRDKFK